MSSAVAGDSRRRWSKQDRDNWMPGVLVSGKAKWKPPRKWKERRKTDKYNGWTARRRHQDDSRYLEQVDVEFIMSRRQWIKGQVRMESEDQTLIQGYPTEWVLKEPEVQAAIGKEWFSDKPFEWLVEEIEDPS